MVGAKKFTFKLSNEPTEACKAQLNPPFGTESSNLTMSSSPKCSLNFTKFHLQLQARLVSYVVGSKKIYIQAL
jgi:hypothetical protein